MFARQVFRAAQPLKQSVRRYASPPGPASGGSNTAIYVAVGAAALGGGGYYYLRTSKPEAGVSPSSNTVPASPSHETTSPQIAKPEDHAPASSEEQNTVPSSPSPSASAPQASAFTGGAQGFIDLKLDSVEQINHNTKKFRFALPNSDDVSGLQIASALLTKYKGPEMEKPVIRPYTPTSDEDEKGYIDLVVKRYPNGPMSEHLHNMEPGQRLDFKGPIPKYPWSPNKHDHIALIAGGTGITPMYQLARAIFKNPTDKTKVTLIFGNLTEADILLKREFEDLENTYPQRFRAFYMVDSPGENWQGGTGHITKELLKTVLPEPTEENVKIFVCGPPGLYKAVSGTKKSPAEQGELTGMLKELGYGQDQVYKF